MSNDIKNSLILPEDGHCFHCGDPLPNEPFFSHVLGEQLAMCCMGCQLASQSIVEAGLEQYYLDRSEINRTANLPSELYQLQAYDHEEVKSQFIYQQQGLSVAELSVNNLRCSACGWLIESCLQKLDGVERVQVNLTHQRMRVLWDEQKLPVSQILAKTQSIGYDAKPYRQDTHEAMLAKHNRRLLFQLGVAALGAMQAMMFAVALYFGEYYGMAWMDKQFLQWVSLFVSFPVFCIAGLPFFQSAYHAICAKQVNMDVPISIAIIITFTASLYATFSQTGEIYYDSVSMLIFFLLAGKFVEHNARLKAANMANDLVVVEPLLVAKLGHEEDLITSKQENTALIDQYLSVFHRSLDQPFASEHLVSAQSIQVGDIVRIDAGSQVICDGILLSQTATVSQSLLTGESDLIEKTYGDTIIGGSQNDSQPFFMQVSALPKDSQIGMIDCLINRALSEKPQIALKADQMARWFVARVLIVATLVFGVWYMIDPSRAIWVTVSVLVATCPCALSLATPIALTVATNRLAQQGFLITRGHTLSTLAQVTHIAFDKTGTLTYGKPNLLAIELLPTAKKQQQNQQDCLILASSLEIGSRHPIAHALLTATRQLHLPTAQNLQFIAGGGVTATIHQRQYRLGHWQFACPNSLETQPPPNLTKHHASTSVILSVWQEPQQNWQPLCHFYFHDKIRDTAADCIQTLHRLGIETLMLTGDPSPNAQKVAQQLQIKTCHFGLTPDDKVTHLQTLQQQNKVIQMVGDGVNDAPVLATANISTAMAGASDLAQVSSDSLILNGQIENIVKAQQIAKKTDQIIQQNFNWALGYNLLVLIPASFGYVPPWLAAIGMSLSSLLVVLNALRIKIHR